VEVTLAEVGGFIQARWRKQPAVLLAVPAFVLALWGDAKLRERAGRDAAGRRGVTRRGEGPPEPPRAPRVIGGLGGIAGFHWLKHRGVRYPRGRAGVPALVSRIVTEVESRRSWRGWVPPSGGR
jgi:hypothetical protein